MGSSRDIAIGPVAVVSLLLGTLLQNEVDPSTHVAEYLRLAFTATFFAGITQATLGVLRYLTLLVKVIWRLKFFIAVFLLFTSTCFMFVLNRLGFLIDFLSHAAIVGFMGGAAITIALQQLKGFLGIKKFTKKTDIISVMHSVIDSAHHGVSSLSFLCPFLHELSSSFLLSFLLRVCILQTWEVCCSKKSPKLLIPIFQCFAVELANHNHWSIVFNFPFGCQIRCTNLKSPTASYLIWI